MNIHKNERSGRKQHLPGSGLTPAGVPDAPAERPGPSPEQASSRSFVSPDHNSTIIAVVEMSRSSWHTSLQTFSELFPFPSHRRS